YPAWWLFVTTRNASPDLRATDPGTYRRIEPRYLVHPLHQPDSIGPSAFDRVHRSARTRPMFPAEKPPNNPDFVLESNRQRRVRSSLPAMQMTISAGRQ